MNWMKKAERWIVLGGALLAAGVAGAAPIAPGYVIQTIATPGPATSDVLATGGALFVGVGFYGAGNQSVVRIDGGGTTTIATGFNSLSGFTYDAVNDRLIVGDNGLEAGGTTGDTVYGIDNPFATPGVVPVADTLELAPSGSTPGVADVLLDPSDPTRLFVTDSWDQDLKLVDLSVAINQTSVLQSGLGFAAGLETVGGTPRE